MDGAGRVGIVAALAAEARTLGCAAPSEDELALMADGSLLAVSGMGFEAAEHDARALLDAGCSALASWGLAGALDPQLSAGTIVVPEVLMLQGAPDLNPSPDWRERVLGALGAQLPMAIGGKLLTSRGALATAADKRQAFLGSGAVAVDMESYAIANVAQARGLPFIAVRVIVDAAGDELPAALLEAVDSRGRVAAGRLLLRLLAAPRNVAPLLALGRRYRVARRSLREAARAGAPGKAAP